MLPEKAATRVPVAAFALLTVALLAGCAAHSVPAASPPASPSPSARATDEARAGSERPPIPAIPRVSAALEDRQTEAGAAPVRLVAPELGIDVPIEAVGLDGQGRMGLPENPAVASWYVYGAAPGDPAGSAVIAAHVDSIAYGLGPFARLETAPAGTRVEVTSTDGTVRSFALESTQVVPKPEMDWAVVFRRDGPPALTLVTCGGEFDWENRHYLSSVIVTARATG
ncbi:class F sortase [Agromyces laixinhei]|uniref:class F sortase n=1 Tax=Agromyces laixinhei TaxID=2585717 RepID=UPI0012EDDC20|nr:class F sortase [Agromyces laixinhei]